MSFSEEDKEFMKLALEEARKAFKKGNVPIGAVLVENNKLIDKAGNSQFNEDNWASHAEAKLIKENSSIIRKKVKKESSKLTLYTTLEPCLMCFGIIILHRISRIVYGCPDPFSGATHINPNNMSAWYNRHWPKIEGGLFKKESYDLMIEYMKNKEDWKRVLAAFEKMRK